MNRSMSRTVLGWLAVVLAGLLGCLAQPWMVTVDQAGGVSVWDLASGPMVGGVMLLVWTAVFMVPACLVTWLRDWRWGVATLGLAWTVAAYGGAEGWIFRHADSQWAFAWLLVELVGWAALGAVAIGGLIRLHNRRLTTQAVGVPRDGMGEGAAVSSSTAPTSSTTSASAVPGRPNITAHSSTVALGIGHDEGEIEVEWADFRDSAAWTHAAIVAGVGLVVAQVMLVVGAAGQVEWVIAVAMAMGGAAGRVAMPRAVAGPSLLSPLAVGLLAYAAALILYGSADARLAQIFGRAGFGWDVLPGIALAMPVHYVAAGLMGMLIGRALAAGTIEPAEHVAVAGSPAVAPPSGASASPK